MTEGLFRRLHVGGGVSPEGLQRVHVDEPSRSGTCPGFDIPLDPFLKLKE